jgi:DNA repair exonuclease SbcCD nuclease subunit
MKVAVIGDVHMGASYNLGKIDPITQHNTRLLDFSNTFNNIIDIFISKGVEVVVLTGDLYETRHPTSAQLNAFSRCIRRATEKGLDVRIVVGNHDQQRTIDTTTVDIYNELKLDKIKVYPEMSAFKIGDVNIVAMPYRDRRMTGADTNSGAIQILREQLNDLTEGMTGFKLLVGHLMLEKTAGEDNPDGFSINELILPHDMFGGFDVVVMGHVHRHSIVNKSDPTIIYSGSMERVSMGEKDHKKVTLIIDTVAKSVEVVPTKVRNLYELSFDYDGDKLYKHGINNVILGDIDKFCATTDLKDSVVKIVIKLNEHDHYFLNQQKIREHLLSKGIDCFYSLQTSTIISRQLRNKEITEDVSGLKAMESFISGLIEPESVKNRLHKYAREIILEVEGK